MTDPDPIIAVDGDEIARAGEMQAMSAVVAAVCCLQQRGVRVLLTMDPAAMQPLRAHPQVTADRLLFVPKGHVDTDGPFALDLLHLAKLHACSFVSNVDCRALATGSEAWKLPIQLRWWLQQACSEAQLPPGGLRQLRYRFANGIFTLIAAEPPLDVVVIDRAPKPPDPVAEDIKEATVPATCVVSLRRGEHSEERLLCVRCEEPGSSLFRDAAHMAAAELGLPGCGPGASDVKELDSSCGHDDFVLKAGLNAQGGIWMEPYLLATVMNGKQAGLRAVGVGSNLRKRHRAAQLALATTAALHGRREGRVLRSELRPLVLAFDSGSDGLTI